MSNETIADLRGHLFAALRGLTDPEKPMDIERARAVSDMAQTIINSAKVEVDYLRVSGSRGSQFLGAPEGPETSETATGTKTVTHQGCATITRHRLT